MRGWLVVALVGCGGGKQAPDALVCSYGGTDCNGVCVNTATDRLNCGACGNVCGAGASCWGQCDPTSSCLGIQIANPAAASGVYTDALIRGHTFFCDMRTSPPHAYVDLIIVPKSDSAPTERVLTAADLQDPIFQQAFLYFYNSSNATSPSQSFDATDPCVADGATGSWLELGGSRLFLKQRQDTNTTSFIEAIPYQLILGDTPSPTPLASLPDDFFTTYPATTAPQAACSDGNNAALALMYPPE